MMYSLLSMLSKPSATKLNTQNFAFYLNLYKSQTKKNKKTKLEPPKVLYSNIQLSRSKNEPAF